MNVLSVEILMDEALFHLDWLFDWFLQIIFPRSEITVGEGAAEKLETFNKY